MKKKYKKRVSLKDILVEADYLDKADFILMKYPKLLKELKEIGYIIRLINIRSN